MENKPHLGKTEADDSNARLSIQIEFPAHSRRRRSTQTSINLSGDADLEYDLDDLFDSPRLFTEMIALSEEDPTNIIWKEIARWVRFEEDVEEGGKRWSKPRVSTLSLHSLFELRSFLVNGTIVLDVEGSTVEEIFKNAINNPSTIRKLSNEDVNKILETLRRRRVHLFEILKKNKSPQDNEEQKQRGENFEKITIEDRITDTTDLDDDSYGISFKGNKSFLKKLPEGAEAANILVGEVRYLKHHFCMLVRLKDRVNLGNLNEVPIPSRFLFLLLGPMGELERLTEVGRSVATLLSDEVFREVAFKGKTKTHVLAGMDEFLDASTLLPPGEWDPNIRIEPPESAPTKESRKSKKIISEEEEEEEERKYRERMGLTRTGRLFGGLINDFKRKAPFYFSDFKDALALQSVATFFFLYFACLAPIVTFGGLLGEATGNNIAVMESLVSGLVCGLLYGFFSGQPLTLLGSTGPVLVFETIIYDFCTSHDWNYMSFRFWIGMWAAGILLILVAVDASALVCYITRFTEENFATLIALIFIYKAVEKVFMIGEYYPMHMHVINEEEKFCECFIENGNESYSFNITDQDCKQMNGTLIGDGCEKYYPDIFLLSILLCLGTFLVSTTLKESKSGSFFPAKVRGFISDFAVIISIIIMSLIDFNIGINTPKLEVPTTFKPTSPDRGWLIYPFNGNPWWSSLAACAPALLACILIFMDQQITAVIMNRKENKLKKGGGYHLDLFILAILIAINSLMGLPWFVAATVLSINHVNSLKKESECAAPGERPQFYGIRENRVTHILIFIFIGLSVVMTPILQKIPMAVLFGVFLYMGIAALKGIQFFDRILLIFMPVKYQPNHPYLKKVPIRRVHLFTAIQLSCLVMLWIIKSFSQTSILFPLMLVIMVGIRKSLDWVFTKAELKSLDDALPEFSRKAKIEEEEEDEEGGGANTKGGTKRIPSATILNGSIILSPSVPMNMADELIKTELWRNIDKSIKPVSRINSRRSSRRDSEILRQIRKNSLMDPILDGEKQQEDEVSCHRRISSLKVDAVDEEELQCLTAQDGTSN